MSQPPESPYTLVPASIQVTGGSHFQQTCVIDWIALGQQPFSASVAVLSRLSSAGVDPLTVAVGQALCSRIPLGLHGEKVLSDAMSSLKACSSFEDVVWFGVGVRHILRELVQTSQGASLAALCAALSETHSVSTSAMVMYEMANQSGTPTELTPSFAQCETLVKVCSSRFCHTTFGLRVEQMLRLGGYQSGDGASDLVGHPQDLAQVISAIGDVTAGRLLGINVSGGSACSWVAVLADFIFGLRVAVRAKDGPILFTNFDDATTRPQVELCFQDSDLHIGVSFIDKSFMLRHGREFIERFFRGSGRPISGCQADASFLGGRVSWDSMFQDIFSTAAGDILQPRNGPLAKFHRRIGIISTICEKFASFYIAGAAVYVYLTRSLLAT